MLPRTPPLGKRNSPSDTSAQQAVSPDQLRDDPQQLLNALDNKTVPTASNQGNNETLPIIDNQENNIMPDNENANIEAIQNCKLPPFWKSHPDLWFTQVESIFQSCRIRSDDSKYHLLVSSLSSDVLVEIADVLRSAPDADKYPHLKAQILGRFADSSDRQLQKLLNELELGDKKPSQLLRQMRALAADKVSEDAVRIKWLALLPNNVQRVLKIFKATTLDELAVAADQLMETPSTPGILELSPLPAVAAASRNQPTDVAAELAAIRVALAQLIAVNRELLDNHRRPGPAGPPNRRQSRSPSPNRNKSPFCYYHWRFGASAKNCQQPCTFKPQQQQPSEN